MGLALAYMGYTTATRSIFLCSFVIGMGLSATNIIVMSQLRRHVSADYQGRVMACLMFFAGSLAPVSYGITGYVIEKTSKIIEIYYSIGSALMFFALMLFFTKSLQGFFKAPILLKKNHTS